MTQDALTKRIAELEQELERVRARERLATEVDEALERSMLDHLPLRRTLDMLFPLLGQHTGATRVLLRTYDEDLLMRDFAWPADAPEIEAAVLATVTETKAPHVERAAHACTLARPIDVASEFFGAVAISYDRVLSEAEQQQGLELLNSWCEELDNYLSAISRAREKHLLTRRLSEALRHPVLEIGLDRAIDLLQQNIDFDDLILVYHHDDDPKGVTLNYRVIKGGQLIHDSRRARDPQVDAFVRSHSFGMLQDEGHELPGYFGITHAREEVLITGLKDKRVIGRIVVASSRGDYNTYDRDILERFSDSLRMRIVDYNREWKQLSLCFPAQTVSRLLAEEGYARTYLAPRERDAAVLFCDISGFTRVSEQLLQEPRLIGKLVDRWGARVVDIVWELGGVFDKMVGDCVIGLWGPPFQDLPAREACRRAAAAARRIRDFTRSLGADPAFPQLHGADPPLGVATGLNYCPLVVGRFGPNEDYTGFSSGMNSAARLQGLAVRDEILCMESFVEQHGDEALFGPRRTARVKNVAEPIAFRPLEG